MTGALAGTGAAAAARPAAIELRGISKSFGAVEANRDIDLAIAAGTIHGIVGENGAGKSTLMSILYGTCRPDAGRVLIDGAAVPLADAGAAIRAGIGMVHQHFKLVENFTVLENVILGAEGGPRLGPALARARALLLRLAAEYGLAVDPDAVAGDLSVGQRQRVEILKALYRDARILILDEPTGVLTPAETEHLFRILAGLRDEGRTILLITHKLREIMAATDRVSVMRRGRMVATLDTAATSPAALAELMVGRPVLLRVAKRPATPGAPLLEVEDLRVRDAAGAERLRGVSLTLHAGEILGIAGVAGNGQSELLEALGGLIPAEGRVRLNGRALDLGGRPAAARARRAGGLAHVPEDRQRLGLVMDFAAWENMVLGHHRDPAWTRAPGLLDIAAIRAGTAARMADFDVRPPEVGLPARAFSGGNQQKIVLAREIGSDPAVLLIGQPTRGVDIGAIEFIHRRMLDLRDAGRAILLVSVELDEILSLADRVAVMFDGRLSAARETGQTTEADLGLLMAGAAA